MKLKTLKELEHQKHETNDGSIINTYRDKELKAEAVKWVKHIKPKGDMALWTWIVRFFNLTEEDLG